VVPAVECRCDEQALDDRLEARGQIEVAVLEEIRDAEDELEEQHGLGRYPEGHDGREAHGRGEEELSRVEAEGGRHVEARVRVMDLVEAPEDRHLVIGPMPEVGDEIEPQDPDAEATKFPPFRGVLSGQPGGLSGETGGSSPRARRGPDRLSDRFRRFPFARESRASAIGAGSTDSGTSS
jgi:hypothetical protein